MLPNELSASLKGVGFSEVLCCFSLQAWMRYKSSSGILVCPTPPSGADSNWLNRNRLRTQQQTRGGSRWTMFIPFLFSVTRVRLLTYLRSLKPAPSPIKASSSLDLSCSAYMEKQWFHCGCNMVPKAFLDKEPSRVLKRINPLWWFSIPAPKLYRGEAWVSDWRCKLPIFMCG